MSKYKFGKKSKEKLSQVDDALKETAVLALSWELMDFAIIEGIRTRDKQNEYFNSGKSKVQWPNGAHNIQEPGDKSRAFDVAPVINGKISWKKDHCLVLAGIMLAAAKSLGHSIRWGGNWDMDGEPITDQSFQDLVHYEIRR
jgi:peptidoglycan L-alanyl-D-glutamate endopeptidase CwlK